MGAMHPDRNLIFFTQKRDGRLILYDMDRQEVCALGQSFLDDYGTMNLTPYVPYLLELFLGVIGAHKSAQGLVLQNSV